MKLLKGDCLDRLKELENNSVDSIVTDPPYGLSFMGKKWDYDVPSVAIWEECLRVLKPGGYLLSFAGTRTQHRMAVNIEDAGFEIRDVIMWVYGQGFPKSLNIWKAIDKLQGNYREKFIDNDFLKRNPDTGQSLKGIINLGLKDGEKAAIRSKGFSVFEGWGTALKPAVEPITIARKPLSEKTVAANVLKWGTGGLNIDGCRVRTDDNLKGWGYSDNFQGSVFLKYGVNLEYKQPRGRWPANLILDESDEVLALFPVTKSGSILPHHKSNESENRSMSGKNYARGPQFSPGSEGSAARFFYCAEHDISCSLCYNTYSKATYKDLDIWNHIHAHSVKQNLPISKATKEFIVQANVTLNQNKNLVQNVKSAGKMCDLCAMSIAVALVKIKSLDFNNEELQAILDFITHYKRNILIQSLVSFAELWENIDTVPTIQSLSILFGYVQLATEKNTSLDIQEKEELKSGRQRFVYCAKASKSDRDGSNHPTMKPTDLMRYLCRLVTQPNGIVLDPFMGSGSTGKAAIMEGFDFIGIERDEDYFNIAKVRIEK